MKKYLRIKRNPKFIFPSKRLNTIVLGLPKTGKSLVAKALYENHKRKLSVIDEIVDDLVELTSQENPACSRNNLTWGQGEAVFGRETDAE